MPIKKHICGKCKEESQGFGPCRKCGSYLKGIEFYDDETGETTELIEREL